MFTRNNIRTLFMKKFLNKHFTKFIFLLSFSISVCLLFSARELGLLPFPQEGTDQLTMISAAADMYRGHMPAAGYLYSPLYTLFLYLLVVLAHGNLIIMRLFQALLCAFSPVLIYKLARRIHLDYETSQTASLLYCFYGAAALISLSFLRAGPLAFCFILFAYLLVDAFIRRKRLNYIYAGAAAALCVLGRENFAPVVLSPLLLLFFRDIRRYIKKSHIIVFLTALICTILPVSIYNYICFRSFAIIPGAFENIFTIFHGSKEVRASLGESTLHSVLTNMPVQICKFASSYEIPNSLSFYAHKDVIGFMVIFFIPFNLLLGFAITATYFLRKNRGVMLLALLTSAFCGSMLFFNMLYRYRVPVVPVVTLLAGAGITYIVRIRPKYKMIIPLLFITVFFILTYTSPAKLRPAGELTVVAEKLITLQQYSKAEKYIDNINKDSVNKKRLYYILVSSLAKDGDMRNAERIAKKHLMETAQRSEIAPGPE